MIGAHEVSPELFDGLATGFGGADAVNELWPGQHSRRLLLLRLLVDRSGPDAAGKDAVAAIVAAEERDAAAREVLIEPMVGVWAAATIRAMMTGSEVSSRETGHLAAVAAAAAIRAGSDAEVRGQCRDGWLYLPAIGRIRVPADREQVQLTVDKGRLRIDGVEKGPDSPDWQGRRRLTVAGGRGLTVFVEDLDPYRDAYHVPPADRLALGELDIWHRRLAETWRILTDLAPNRTAELMAGLHSLVPLSKQKVNAAHSATAREAVGVVGLDLPNGPADFAVALVHEFQHSKLSALLDIVPLYDGSSTQTFFAPWRADPRPLGGLFQGVYAFLGVADTWRVLSEQPDEFPFAQREFAQARVQVADGLDTLAASGGLTAAGERFVRGMTEEVARLHAVDVPGPQIAAAEQNLAARRATWQHLHR